MSSINHKLQYAYEMSGAKCTVIQLFPQKVNTIKKERSQETHKLKMQYEARSVIKTAV